MGFFDWFMKPVQNQYADFTGRTSRQAYWMFVLVYLIIYVGFVVLDVVLGTTIPSSLFSLAILIPSLSIAARRLHDIGKSGWWQLIGLIPLIGWIVLIIWLAQKSDTGANKYGPGAVSENQEPQVDIPPAPAPAPAPESEQQQV